MDHLLAMKLFVNSVDLGSFSRVASQQRMQASSVSRYISSLEKSVGVPLLRRSTRQLILTDAGSEFYDRSKLILEEIGEAWRCAEANSASVIGSLNISAPQEFGILQLSDLIPKFMNSHPGLSVELTLGESEIASAKYDLSIHFGEPQDSRLYAHRFARNQYIICCAPAYLDLVEEPILPSMLSEKNCIVHGNQRNWEFCSAKSSVDISVEVSGNFRSNMLTPVLDTTLAGMGFARLPIWLAGPYIHSGQLVVILDKYQVKCQDSLIYGLYPEKRSLSPKSRTFIDFLAEHFSKISI